ncbi:MAG: HD domain-containing protein [Cyclobacteriaceae bacterium]|jgi:putative nucleotidyltransferase with HDIG domain|nr:HD domain-containing protein [Cyclobacteriaceae bacterium]
MNRSEAEALLAGMTQSPSLLRHMKTVALVMEAYAKHVGENEEEWYVAGLLHDADYEAFPDQHPQVIVARLRQLGESRIANAIAAHYTKWNQPYETRLDQALLACDELTGFIVACSQVRPDGIAGLEVKSVVKKLKDKGFAAKVERDEVYQGAERLGVELTAHIGFIIHVLRPHAAELGI